LSIEPETACVAPPKATLVAESLVQTSVDLLEVALRHLADARVQPEPCVRKNLMLFARWALDDARDERDSERRRTDLDAAEAELQALVRIAA